MPPLVERAFERYLGCARRSVSALKSGLRTGRYGRRLPPGGWSGPPFAGRIPRVASMVASEADQNPVAMERQIDDFIASQPPAKRSDLAVLHRLAQSLAPGCRLWFSDGRNSEGKVVANPTVGYGCYTIQYADGATREFFQVGLSANTSGISVYVMGLEDKTYLARTFGTTIGKANVTGYCIKFKSLAQIDIEVLAAAMRSVLGK